jgi:site-specific DNA recombinase
MADARIMEEKIAAFIEVMRANVLNGETPFRRAYILHCRSGGG